eukprot:4434054-Pyramimonas_sp.AAC.2
MDPDVVDGVRKTMAKMELTLGSSERAAEEERCELVTLTMPECYVYQVCTPTAEPSAYSVKRLQQPRTPFDMRSKLASIHNVSQLQLGFISGPQSFLHFTTRSLCRAELLVLYSGHCQLVLRIPIASFLQYPDKPNLAGLKSSWQLLLLHI